MTIPAIYAYALEIQAHTGAEVVTLYISTSPALVTKVGDTPPSKTFLTGLIQPGNYEIGCFKDGKTYGAASIGFGEIILNNDVGQFDYLLNYAFDGRPATLRRIDAALVASSAYPAAWTTVYTGTLNMPLPAIPGYNQGTITIPWRDRMVELQVPLPLAVFKGDNALPLGTEGTADDLANKTKPLILGQVLEMAPPCCNTDKLIYAVSAPTGGMLDLVTDWDAVSSFDAISDFFGTILGGTATDDIITNWDAITDFDSLNDIFGARRSGIASATVYDAGALIPQQAVYVDENDMMSNAPTAGYCRILPANGYVRFGSQPVGQVTVSCTDNSGARDSAGSIIRGILRDYMRWDTARYSVTDLATADSQCTHAQGVVITDSKETVAQLLDQLCTGGGLCYYMDALGVFRIFQVRDPATLTADFSLSALQIAGLTRLNNEGISAKAVRLKQQKCWTVQKSGLAGSVTADRRAWVGNEWRENLSKNLTTEKKHLLSDVLEFETAFAVDGQDEADRRRDLYSVRRDFWEIEVSPRLFDFTALRLGMVGNIDFQGRFGVGNKNLLLIGIAADLLNEKTTLTVWG